MFNLNLFKMVTIQNYITRKSKKGGTFNVLVLSGGVEPVKNANGKTYFTSRTCTVASSFDEQTCKDLIGSKFPGSIEKVECDPYEYTIPNTNNTVTLSYKWDYVDSVEETMKEQLVSAELVY